MSKSGLYIIVALIFLIASILFSFTQKKEYYKSLELVKQERQELEKTIALKELWSAKGIKSKMEKILNSIPKAKKVNYKYKRGRVEFKLNSLTDKEINRVLSKLAKMPIQFKKLLITRSGDNFILECLCVW